MKPVGSVVHLRRHLANPVLTAAAIPCPATLVFNPGAVRFRGAPEAFDLRCRASRDAVHWGRSRLVLGSEQVPWANAKIGPGAPPLRVGAG